LSKFDKAKTALGVIGFAAFVGQAYSDAAKAKDFLNAFADPSTARGQFFLRSVQAASNIQHGSHGDTSFLDPNSPIYQNTQDELEQFMENVTKLSPAAGREAADAFLARLADNLRDRIDKGNSMVDEIDRAREDALREVNKVSEVRHPISWRQTISNVENYVQSQAHRLATSTASIRDSLVAKSKSTATAISKESSSLWHKAEDWLQQKAAQASAQEAKREKQGITGTDPADGSTYFWPSTKYIGKDAPNYKPDNAPGHWERRESMDRWVYVFRPPPPPPPKQANDNAN